MESGRGEILRRLWSFTAAACGDPVFRRELRYQPWLALARYGFCWEEGVPDQLPIRHYEISVNFEEALLFGLPGGIVPPVRPWPSKAESKLLFLRAKPLLLEHGLEGEMSGLALQLRSEGLTTFLSPYEFVPAGETPKGSYSNLAIEQRPAVPGSGRWRTLIAGWEPDRVEVAWLCLLFGWDEFLGRLLGYPNCCAAEFIRVWPEARRNHHGDVADLMLQSSSGAWVGRFGWETNIFGRYFGIEAIHHFPCQWNCPQTVRLARRNYKVLDAFRLVDSERLVNLAAPVLYSREEGVVLFPGSRVEEHGGDPVLSFEVGSLLATDPSRKLARRLRESGGRLVVCGQEIAIGKERIEAKLIDFSGAPAGTTTQDSTAQGEANVL